ncbi:MAG: NAD(P) transhydrogenase subunit alpha [bacterium]
MLIGVLKEINDNRVSLVPQDVKNLTEKGFKVVIEEDAGKKAGFDNQDYINSGADIKSRKEVLQADIILSINRFPEILKSNSFYIGMSDPYDEQWIKNFVENRINYIALELIPRISRAQSMDVLSSMATIAGYKAVILAANYSIKMFPLLMTAAGTVTPAKILVIGAGVAGLQAIATSKRLGANVYAFDPRPATKEQIKSVGATPIEFSIPEIEEESGYAKEISQELLQKEQEIILPYVLDSDIIITSAAVPGKKAPLLITQEMVDKMKNGSVIVDLVANSGGNCQLTKPDQIITYNSKIIIGLTNLPSLVPFDASKLYSRNIYNLIIHLSKNTNKITPNFDDEIDKNIFAVFEGQLLNPRIKQLIEKTS